MNPKGALEIICGSMFSGKSEELIRRLRRAEFAKQKLIVFKHSLDTRKTIKHVISHNGTKIKAIAISDPKNMLAHINESIDIVGIDEVQFFDQSIIAVVLEIVKMGKKVITAGLDLDFRGIPFGPMPALMALSDKTLKLKAICVKCGSDAHHSQRIINGSPARFSDPIILPGAEECYQARCRGCFTIDRHLQV
jgi:thymidine kinase